MELNLSDVDFYTILTDKMLVIKGSLNDLTIQDLSNYPKIIYHEEDYFKVIKKEIFGKTEKQRDSSILDFSYTKIISSDLIEDNFDSFIDLKIHSIKANVYVQIIMNLVDYFMIQILGVINNPDLFIQNLQEPNFKNTHISEVIAKIKNPRFMKLSIFAENFFIVLKPLPDSEEFFVVKLTKIEVNNKITKSKRQILNENPVMSKEEKPEELSFLYNEIYQVLLSNFVISVQRKGQPIKHISSQLEFNLMYRGICFEKEYEFCYQNLSKYNFFLYNDKFHL